MVKFKLESRWWVSPPTILIIKYSVIELFKIIYYR